MGGAGSLYAIDDYLADEMNDTDDIDKLLSKIETTSIMRENYKPKGYLSYKEACTFMYGYLDNNFNNEINCIYTGMKQSMKKETIIKHHLFDIIQNPSTKNVKLHKGILSKKNCKLIRQTAYNNGKGVNCEHIWPQSHFKRTHLKHVCSDLHNMLPANTIINSLRNDYIFGNVENIPKNLLKLDDIITKTSKQNNTKLQITAKARNTDNTNLKYFDNVDTVVTINKAKTNQEQKTSSKNTPKKRSKKKRSRGKKKSKLKSNLDLPNSNGIDFSSHSEIDRRLQVFEPREISKGNIARCIFYIALIYGYKLFNPKYSNENIAKQNLKWFENLKNDCLEWNHLDLPDSNEISRMNIIAKIQGNINPFIIDPNCADKIFGGFDENEWKYLIGVIDPPRRQIFCSSSSLII